MITSESSNKDFHRFFNEHRNELSKRLLGLLLNKHRRTILSLLKKGGKTPPIWGMLKLPEAVGIPEEQLREASKSAVCKINIDTDSRLAMTAAIRQYFAEHPEHFDPRKYLGPARENMKKMYIHKIVDVLSSDGKLAK